MRLEILQEKWSKSPFYKWWILIAVEFALLFVGANSVMVNLALPEISHFFKTPIAISKWFLIAPSVIMTLFFPVFGKVATKIGYKKLFLSGMVCLTLSSCLCAVAPSIVMLIISQTILGIGATAILAICNGILFFTFSPDNRFFAMSLNPVVSALGNAIGFILGGLFIDLEGWTSIYWINIPIGILGTVFSFLIFSGKTLGSDTLTPPAPFDFKGSFFFAFSLGVTLIALSECFFSPWVLLLIAISITGFILQEKKARDPILQLPLFKNGIFTVGMITRIVIQIISSIFLFFIPLQTSLQFHISSHKTGWVMASFAAALLIAGPIGGELSQKYGSKLIRSLGFSFALCSILTLFSLESPIFFSDASFWMMSLALFFLGIAIGFFNPANTTHILNNIPKSEVSSVSSFIWCASYLGNAIGPAIGSLILYHKIPKDAVLSPVILQKTVEHSMEFLFPIGVLGLLLCLLPIGKPLDKS